MKLTKSGALKASLLMVLAANVSWEHVDFGSAQLASEAVGTSGSVSAPAPTGDGKVSASPEAVTVKANGAGPTPVTTAKPAIVEGASEAPQNKKYSDQEPYRADVRLCGEVYKVTYSQVEREGQPMTEVVARKSSDNSWDITLILRTSLVNTVAEKASTDKLLAKNLFETRSKKGEACPTDSPVVKTATTAVAETTVEDEKATREEDKKTLAEDIKNCKVDKKGELLEKGDRMECLVGALEHADKRVDRKGPNGKRLSEEAFSKLVLAEVKNLHKMLKPMLKSEMLAGAKKTKRTRGGDDDGFEDRDLTDRSERAEAAQDAAQRAMDALEEIADVYDLGKSSRTGRSNNVVSKMIGELSALKNASKAREKAELYAEEATDLRDDMKMATTDLRSAYSDAYRNPLDPMAQQNYRSADQQLQLIQNDYRLFREGANSHISEQYNLMKKLQNAKLLTASEFKDFSRPMTDIQQMMREAQNMASQAYNPNATVRGLDRGSASQQIGSQFTESLLGDDYQMPSNLSAIRANGMTNFASSAGIPSRAPVLNLQTPPRL